MTLCVRGLEIPLPPLYAGAMKGKLAEKIKAIRTSLEMNQEQFAEKLGTTQSTVARWESGSKPRGDMLHAIAVLGHTSLDRLLDLDDNPATNGDISVVGYVGAGATVYPFDDYPHGGGMDTVERPPFVQGKAVAVEVRGDSLFPVAENGWRLVYTGEQALIEDEIINRLCVVQVTDGPLLVKKVARGSQPGHFHLISTNAPVIEDVRIDWAAQVKAIIPA